MFLFRQTFVTPIGEIIGVATADALLCLDFADRFLACDVGTRLEHDFETACIQNKETPLLTKTGEALQAYFRKEPPFEKKTFENNSFENNTDGFDFPRLMRGTPFQQKTWQALCRIPFGTTCSYTDLAQAIGMPKATRAVANANGQNHLSILIPCHRVIRKSGDLGGYAGGLDRKKWLLAHEAQ